MRWILLFSLMIITVFNSSALARTVSLKEIREAGVVRQEWDVSCAAATMATVLTYYYDNAISERNVAKGLLRQTTPEAVRRQGGFSLLDMKHYADELGYRGIGFRGLDLDTLADLNTPIIPIRIHGYNHFVVFRGISPKGQIRVADPAFGNRLFDRQKFERIWMGGIAFTITKEMT